MTTTTTTTRNRNISIIPLASAIDTAIRNADKMFAQGYTVKQSVSVPETWFCIKPGTNGRVAYMVNTIRRTCDCEQFKYEGICKHQKFIDDEIKLREEEADEAAAWEAFGELISENFAEGGTEYMSL